MITVVGESIVDVLVSGDGDATARPGGSPANVAVGLSRLGNAVALLTRYGRDSYGNMLAEHLEGNAVTLAAQPVDEWPTSIATARIDIAGAAAYEFAVRWDLPETLAPDQVLNGSLCLHTGSIAATLEPGAAHVQRLMEYAKGRFTLSYDPNCRPTLMGRPSLVRSRIETLVELSDLVKVSDEDLAWLYPDRDPTHVAQQWLARGPAMVLVTRGAAGCLGVCRAGTVDRPGLDVKVADTVGAGDAFTAGLLDALHRRSILGADNLERLRLISTRTLAAVLDEASLVAALTCTRPGADPPNADEVKSHMEAP